MPLGMAIDILENADMSVFVDAAGAEECRWKLNGNSKVLQCTFLCALKDVQSKVHCNTFELPLNFHQVMVRYQLRGPQARQADAVM